MKRIVSGLKKFAELYLTIGGGGYTLASSVGVVVNARNFLQNTDEVEAKLFRQDVTESIILFLFASLAFAAGIGIQKYRRWGLLLAIGMAMLTVGYSLVQNVKGLSDYHDFTMALPMAVIFVWGILPPTWLEFKQKSLKTA
jgi:hypothetical protein